jgi:ATP-dependent exoDNAse (exonuclease V) beta subunit
VHRLLQRVRIGGEHDKSVLRSMLADLVRPDETEARNPKVLDDVLAVFEALSARSDVRDLYLAGEAWHEVPFTLVRDGGIVRGAIDCLIRNGERITVLEFKTGRPSAGHDRQVEIYRQAAQALFPTALVDARLIYAADRIA